MQTEQRISKIMRTGTASSLILMVAGLIMSVAGRYTEHLHITPISLLTDGAGLIYLGVMLLILTSVFSLVYFVVYFFYNNEKKYALFCTAIIIFLAAVTAFKVLK